MKATMDEKGVIKLLPETPMECWTLQQWRNKNIIEVDDKLRLEGIHYRGSGLLVFSHMEQPE